MNTLILAGWTVVAVLAGIVGYFRLRRRTAPEPVAHFHCPRCGRRLRYRLTRAGGQGMCPRCGRYLSFPAIPGGLAAAYQAR